MTFSFIEGNEAIAWGAITAGCRFFAGYPITPATTILSTMLRLLPPTGGICLQGEDEIASIGSCLGASMAGMKVMTATSGPGISLYSEQISFAIGSEIPIVIVDVQRLGPSTGSATRGADGDIQFLRWGSSSGLPVIVLAPTDVKDCFYLTIEAFNLAEEFRCPVFIASNKEIAMTKESVELPVTKPELGNELGNEGKISLPPHIKIKNRRIPLRSSSFPSSGLGTPFLPFEVPEDRQIPDFLPIGGDTLVRQTSSTHGANGYITTNPDEIGNFQDRLKQKLLDATEQFSFCESYMEDDADTLIITYGVTARAAKEVFNMQKSQGVQGLLAQGKPISLLILKTLYPVPESLIREKAQNVNRVIVVEMNLGQYVREIIRILPDKTITFLGQMNGKLITPQQIREKVLRY